MLTSLYSFAVTISGAQLPHFRYANRPLSRRRRQDFVGGFNSSLLFAWEQTPKDKGRERRERNTFKGRKKKEEEKDVYNLHNPLSLRPSLPSRQPTRDTLSESRDGIHSHRRETTAKTSHQSHQIFEQYETPAASKTIPKLKPNSDQPDLQVPLFNTTNTTNDSLLPHPPPPDHLLLRSSLSTMQRRVAGIRAASILLRSRMHDAQDADAGDARTETL